MNKKFFKPADFIIIIIFAVIALLFFLPQKGQAQKAVITKDGEIFAEIVMTDNTDETIAVGNVTIKIEGRTVAVTDSDCPDKTCVKTGKLTKAGQGSACVPNRVSVFIQGKSDMDILAY